MSLATNVFIYNSIKVMILSLSDVVEWVERSGEHAVSTSTGCHVWVVVDDAEDEMNSR